MNEQEFRAIYPAMINWVQRTLAEHHDAARAVTSFGFERLPRFYQHATLAGTKVVAADKVPVPPLVSMGLDRFSDFERTDMAGITYLDTYFVRDERAWDESLHFHELVHVIQWRILGSERFLALYANGLERFGYRKSPLEVMAYDLQAMFDRASNPFDVEATVERTLQNDCGCTH
jgi:hypothetical protein